MIPDITPFSATSRITLQEYKTRSQLGTAIENAHSGHPSQVVESNNHSGCKSSVTSSEIQTSATEPKNRRTLSESDNYCDENLLIIFLVT